MMGTQLEFDWGEDKQSATTEDGIAVSSLEALRVPNSSGVARTKSDDSAARQADFPSNLPPPDEYESIYDPSHPWYYLERGDHRPPTPVDEIPPSPNVGDFIERRLPKNPVQRRKRLLEFLESERRQVDCDKHRYQEIVERGADALSGYDRAIAYGGDLELARASALALTFNHVSFGLGRIAWLECRIRKGATASSENRHDASQQSSKSR